MNEAVDSLCVVDRRGFIGSMYPSECPKASTSLGEKIPECMRNIVRSISLIDDMRARTSFAFVGSDCRKVMNEATHSCRP